MNRWTIPAVLFFALYAGSCATLPEQSRLQEATAHYRLGVSALNDKMVQQAFVEFHKALELNPNDKEVLNALGIVYLMHLDDTPKAIEYFEKAVKVAPDYSEAYNNLGYSYEKSGSFETAITYYKKAISNPLYTTAEKAYFNIGNAYLRLGRYEAALAAFKDVLKREPNLSTPYMRIALCYSALGKYGDAATAMAQAIKLDPAYNGSREKAIEDLTLKKLKAAGLEENDIRDYLEILKY
ncbi:MAG: tetratricopeptide repeat protein [Thermodesulfovibrionales bacterium]